jgi:acetyl-CoA carboxylase biotin carboxylase subunit
LIVHRPTREQAIACLKRALEEFVIEGVKTTIPLLRDILNHTTLTEGTGDTKFVERTWKSGS